MKASSDLLYQHVLDDLSPYLVDSPEKTATQAAALYLRDSLLKKYMENHRKVQLADQAALELFLKINEGLLSSVRKAEDLRDQHLLGELKTSLDRFWFIEGDRPLLTGLHDCFQNGRCGPGSSIGAKANDFYTKLFDSNLSTTSHLLYNSYMTSMGNCSSLHSSAAKYREEKWGEPMLATHSTLSFVPKRVDISRTICVEPNLNMFYQLGFGRILEERLRSVFAIDLSKQPDFNRELARRGSVDGDFATIDLSSASDSLSVGVLREILPQGMFSWVMSLRTPNTRLPDGRIVPLRMVSTMGNGFTFPLETTIFASVVAASYRVCGVPMKRNFQSGPGNFAVFGDDIIVRKEVFSSVCRLLWLLGFKLNAAKTFVEGPFRESCGHDFYNGHFVRGVYLKTLESPQDRYVAINLLNDWSATTGIPLRSAVQYLLKTVRKVYVSPLLGFDAGIHVPASHVSDHRYDRNGSYKLRYYKACPKTLLVDEHGRLSQRHHGNPYGLELAAVAGHVRSHRLACRQHVVRYVMKRSILPNWDSMELQRQFRRFTFWSWETMTSLNLLS